MPYASERAGYPSRPGNWIYALVDPFTGEIRYIGKTGAYLRRRFKSHIRDSLNGRRTHKAAWIRSVYRAHGEVLLRVVEELDDPGCIAEREIYWIALYRAAGVRLTNSTAGGEGMLHPTEATLAKLRGRKIVHAPNHSEIAREVMRRNWANPEFLTLMQSRWAVQAEQTAAKKAARAAIRAATPHGNTGALRTPENRAKIAAGVRRAYAEGRVRPRPPVSDEARANMRAGQARRHGR